MKKISRRKLENGIFSSIIIIAVISIVILVNYLLSSKMSTKLKYDYTSQKLYTISDQTKNIIDGIEGEVTVYLMAETGKEDSGIVRLMESYTEYSDKVKFETFDPVANPAFANKYAATSASLNSLIFVGTKRSKVVDRADIYEVDTSMFYTTGETKEVFDGEGEITSAIDFVNTDDLPVAYVVQGNDEIELELSLINMIERQNIEVEDLDIITADKIPEDASCIIINSPAKDFSGDKAQMIIDYLKNGGHAFIISDDTSRELKNFQKILSTYGISMKEGIVMEDNPSYYSVENYYLLPNTISHEITQPLVDAKMRVLIPGAQAIEVNTEGKEGVKYTSLFTTSSNAYIKKNAINSNDYDISDIDEKGKYSLGIALTQKDTKIVCFSSSAIMMDAFSKAVSDANWDTVVNSISWMCEHESGIDIHLKDFDRTQLITVDTSDIRMWSIVMIGVIPLLVIVMGVIVSVERRKGKTK